MGVPTRIKRQLAVIGLAAAGTVFLYAVRGILFPFWLAFLLAYLGNPPVARLEQREVPRPVAIILVYLVFAVVVGLAGCYLIPRLVSEMEEIMVVLPRKTQQLYQLGENFLTRLERAPVPGDVKEVVREAAQRAHAFVDAFVRRLFDLVVGLFSRMFSIFLAPFLAYYVLRDWDEFQSFIRELIPVAYRSEVEALFREINAVLSGFIRGQLIVSAVVAGILAVGMALLQVRFALLLGLIAGIFNVIPYLGPLIGALPAVALGLLDSPWKALWTAALFILVNNLEGSVVAPRILERQVGLHPLVLIFVVLAGGHLFGVIGMLLAVPVTAVGRIVLSFAVRNLL